MKKIILTAVLCTLLLSGCVQQSQALIDWVNFIKLNGITYSDVYMITCLWPSSGKMSRGITLPEEFGESIQKALDAKK